MRQRGIVEGRRGAVLYQFHAVASQLFGRSVRDTGSPGRAADEIYRVDGPAYVYRRICRRSPRVKVVRAQDLRRIQTSVFFRNADVQRVPVVRVSARKSGCMPALQARMRGFLARGRVSSSRQTVEPRKTSGVLYAHYGAVRG